MRSYTRSQSPYQTNWIIWPILPLWFPEKRILLHAKGPHRVVCGDKETILLIDTYNSTIHHSKLYYNKTLLMVLYFTNQVGVPSGSDLWSDKVLHTRCAPGPNYGVWDLIRAPNNMIMYDQRSLRSGDGMIRGHFGLGMVWSEVSSFWGWYDRRSF